MTFSMLYFHRNYLIQISHYQIYMKENFQYVNIFPFKILCTRSYGINLYLEATK